MNRSLRVVLVVVGVGLSVGFGILGWRLTEGVRKQKIGATVIRRPGLRQTPPTMTSGIAKGTRAQVRRLNLASLATVTASSVEEGNQTSEGVADDMPDERQWVSAGRLPARGFNWSGTSQCWYQRSSCTTAQV